MAKTKTANVRDLGSKFLKMVQDGGISAQHRCAAYENLSLQSRQDQKSVREKKSKENEERSLLPCACVYPPSA